MQRLEKMKNRKLEEAIDEETGDGISFDCSYNTLEFSFGTELDMNILYQRFVSYYCFVQESLGKYNHVMLSTIMCL